MMPQALRLASNLQVAQVDSRQWAIRARGFNATGANKLLVLIDGSLVGQSLLRNRHVEFSAPCARRETRRGVFGSVTWRF
jgi:hypothetical protein